MSSNEGAITLTAGEVLAVLDAVDYAANDYAYRAEYEEKSGMADEDTEDRDAFAAKAEELSKLADTIRFYAGIEVDRS
jgi:hypothetical protein